METPQQQPYQPPVMPQPIVPQPTHKVWVIPLVVVLVLAGGYFAFAKYRSMWPFSPQIAMESPTPSSTVSPSLSPSISQSPGIDLQAFNSKYFNVSFKYPKGYEAYDSQNYIAVAKDKYQTYQNEVANGDNAFFQIQRFNQTYTREQVIRNNAWLENPRLSKISIDGSEFTKIEGERLGGEVYQYGKTMVIVFDASSLTISQFTGGCVENVDCFAVGNQILTTLKLSSMANWKTYTNSQHGFQIQYPSDWTYDGTSEIFFDKIDPATGKRQFSEGTGGFNLAITNESTNSAYTKVRDNCQAYGTTFNIADSIFSYRAISLAGKNGWEVNCSSEYGGPYTVTILPISTSKTLRISSGYKSILHAQIISSLKFTQ